jgi:hypothetical protein
MEFTYAYLSIIKQILGILAINFVSRLFGSPIIPIILPSFPSFSHHSHLTHLREKLDVPNSVRFPIPSHLNSSHLISSHLT